MSNARFRSTRRIESCDAVIRVYDEGGNVIETDEQAGDFKDVIRPVTVLQPLKAHEGRAKRTKL